MSPRQQSSSPRVVVTGIGAVSSVGTGRSDFWDALIEGHSGVRSLESMPWMNEDFSTRIGAPVDDFDPTAFGISERDASLLDPAAQYALAAARLAIADAGLETELVNRKRGFHQIDEVDGDRCVTVIGTGVGGLPSTVESHRHWMEKQTKKGGKRYWLPMLIPNAIPAQIAIRLQARGECKAVTTACAAGTMAIGDAWRLIRLGKADVAFAGGAEATLSDMDGYALMGFDMLRTMSTRNDDPTHASRPFDAERDGFVLSEGAGILMLESLEHAQERDAKIYAEITGYASNCEAYHIIMLDPEIRQIRLLLQEVLDDSGTEPEEVDYINAHGTSTKVNDETETRAIRAVFGDHADRLKVSATKSMTGHGVGASGALEAAATALTLHEGIIHPTVNLQHPDPECDLDYVPNEAVRQPVRTAITTSYGFGGHNAALLLRRWEE